MTTITVPTAEQVAAIIEGDKQRKDVGFAIAIASPQFDSPQFYFVGNLIDYNSQPLTYRRDTRFELASNTKIFVAALLAYYAQQNPALLTSSLGSYQPPGMASLPDSFNAIALQNLANYTSGLPQDNDGAPDEPDYLPQPYTEKSMYAYLHDGNVSVSGTGTAYTYSNMGFALLALSLPVAVQSTQTFGELIRSELTGPLGMKDTALFTDVPVTELPLGMAQGQPQQSGWPEFPAWLGAGGMVSTIDDMAIWLQLHMGMLPAAGLNGILAPMQNPSTNVTPWAGTQLGLGWFLTDIPANDGTQQVTLPTVWKDGGLVGCSTFTTFLQSPSPGTTPSQAGVVVLTNSSLPEDGQYIAQQVLRLMNGYT